MLNFSCFRALLALLAAAPLAALAQTPGVGIGTTTPAASALLDVSSTTKGLLPPRMSTAQRDAIASPAAGLIIFNTSTSTSKLNTWNGTSWNAALSTTEQPTAVVAGTAVTFSYTGSPQTYTVPAGIRSLRVDAAGAGGGPGNYEANSGGAGVQVQATLVVTPGEVLTLYVGGSSGGQAGGYNGGGSGSAGRSIFVGGGGGGASDVRRSATAPSTSLAERLLVAGGGQVGLIAQEVEQIYPELVSTDAEGFKAQVAGQAGDHAALETLKARAATAETQATATLQAFEARLRQLEAPGAGQARR